MTRGRRGILLAALGLLVALFVASLLVGVADLAVADLFDPESRTRLVLVASRVPRSLALLLAGASMAVAGLIMQHLAHNRFVEPSTAGTMDAAGMGIIVATIAFGSASIMAKLLISMAFAFAATMLFLALVRRIRFKDVIFVPLVGLMFGAVLQSITMFIAYRVNLMQTFQIWMNGDFSGIVRGRYETLWFAAVMAVIAYFFADRFTVAGFGEAFAKNLGVSYQTILSTGLLIVALVTAVVVVTVGSIPFLGLVVPNVVTLVMGDNLRRVLPLTAVAGAAMVLAGDVVGRLIIAPYEIPVGTVLGVVGSVGFLWLILRKGRHAIA